MKNLYSNKRVFLGSLHQKELAISPVLSKELNIRLVTVPWNTDTLGTFSGEIEFQNLKGYNGIQILQYIYMKCEKC